MGGIVRKAKLPVPRRPSIRVEKKWSEEWGGDLVAGVDEAGRGPLAGPVVAAAVVFDYNAPRPIGLADSKTLSEHMRERLFDKIRKCALSYGIGVATAQEVDAFNILEATRLAARRALAQLDPRPAVLVTDFLDFPDEPRPTLALVKGDAISVSVAAASILAKVTRDRLMEAYHAEFPYYGWNKNRGYPTQDHYDAIMEHGPSVLHRLTFSGVGFFNSELRRSRTFELMAAEATALSGDAGSTERRRELRARLDLCRAILPPPDAAELDELLR